MNTDAIIGCENFADPGLLSCRPSGVPIVKSRFAIVRHADDTMSMHRLPGPIPMHLQLPDGVTDVFGLGHIIQRKSLWGIAGCTYHYLSLMSWSLLSFAKKNVALFQRKIKWESISTGKPLRLPTPTSTTSPKIKKHCVWWDKMHVSVITASSCNAQLSYLCVECYNIIIIIVVVVVVVIIIIIMGVRI